ncbi:MAG TPA: recombinase family protein [Terriglobia bacterium]|nr:recombinase family protein [Terriglobia bacterium]
MKVAIYARVSTEDQNADMQLRELREFCARRQWVVYEEFVDEGMSGASRSRPELDRMMNEAWRGKFEAVVVWKFDRFARSVTHLLQALEKFRDEGVDFISLTENIDTSTPMGKMVFTVIAAVAELERSLIGERVRAGLRSARASGKRLGRPTSCVSKDDVWNLVKVHGKTVREAATSLGVSPATIINKLKSRSA